MAGGPASDQIQRCESSIPVVQPLSRAWKNYYHWVAQTLPAILAGIDKGPGLIALPELTSGQEETIRLLGLHDYPRFRIEIGKSYSFRHLKVSDFVAGRSSFEISLHMQRVFEEMKSRVPDRGVRDRKLYVTRRGAGHRNVYNEADLSVLLEHRGFEVVDPGGYSISEQINLFRGASVIVAPHGAALTNIGFCEPGTIVYELFQSDYANACFNRLAQLVGLQYYADAFPSGDTGQPHTRSFSVDLRRIDSCLDTFLM